MFRVDLELRVLEFGHEGFRSRVGEVGECKGLRGSGFRV